MSRVDDNNNIQLEEGGEEENEASPTTVTDPAADAKVRRNGYFVIIAGFIANFIVFGISFTFGVFQEFYLSSKGPLKGKSPSIVSLIGTVATSLTYMLGILNGPLSSRYPIQYIMGTGSIILSLGLILTGSCQEEQTWQFALTQGVMYGIGSSMTYLPPVVCGPQYFSKRRGIAMGLVFAGTGVGGLVMAPVSRKLISALGWRWALRTLGFIAFVFTFSVSFMVKPHPNFRPSNIGLINFRVAKSLKFIIHVSGGFLQSAGYLIPLFYMSSYAGTLGMSYSEGAVLIGVNNAVNAAAKVVLGFGADYVGRINMLLFCCLMSAVTVFALWMVPQKDTFISFVVLYGIFSGPIIALLPACLVELFGVQNYHSVSGLMYFTRGLGNLLGSPIAGLFVKNPALTSTPSDYRVTIIYNGALLAANSIFFLALRGLVASERNWKLKA